MKYKEILKKKSGKNSDRTSTSGKSDQTRVVKVADENLCDVLTTESGKKNTQMLGYLTWSAHIICAQKESGSVLTNLMMGLCRDG